MRCLFFCLRHQASNYLPRTETSGYLQCYLKNTIDMIDSKDTTPAEKDGKYEFQINYSGRDLACRVEKEQNKLHVFIDNNINAELEIQDDGTLTQTSGNSLPESSIEFIKKHVLEHQA